MIDPVFFDFDKEMQQVAIFVTANADLVADTLDIKIKAMLAKGMSPDAVLQALRADLYGGGPLFSGFSQTFKSAAFPVIDNLAQGSVFNANAAAPDSWEWVTTSVEPCKDCEPRHGQVKTYAEWEALGLPRSGFSVCGDYCKCVLVPAGQTGASIADGPVRVTSLTQKRADFQARLQTDPELQARMDNYRASSGRS